ncbi:MAG TPA: hypothetical protein VGK48_13870 [Terriglobia bacterium]|jgi:hypothetical protein
MCRYKRLILTAIDAHDPLRQDRQQGLTFFEEREIRFPAGQQNPLNRLPRL